MKNQIHNLIILWLLLVITYSCTIEKRVHQKGFYISWKNNNSLLVQSTDSLINFPIEKTESVEKNPTTIEIAENLEPTLQSSSIGQNKDSEIPSINNSNDYFQIAKIEKLDKETFQPKAEEKRKIEPIGKLAKMLLFFYFLSFIKLYSFFIFLPIIGFALIILLFVIHIIRVNNNPEKFKQKNTSVDNEFSEMNDYKANVFMYLGILFLILALLTTLILFIFSISAMSVVIITAYLFVLSFAFLINHYSKSYPINNGITLISFMSMFFFALYATQVAFILLLLALILLYYLLFLLISYIKN
jgi:hypothetical protein